MSLSYRNTPVYHERIAALLILLDYACQHSHSRLWIGAIHVILARTEGAHG
jgi:hypothetical protein